MIIDGDDQNYSVSGDELTMDEGGSKMVFKRNSGTPPAKGTSKSGSDDTEDSEDAE